MDPQTIPVTQKPSHPSQLKNPSTHQNHKPAKKPKSINPCSGKKIQIWEPVGELTKVEVDLEWWRIKELVELELVYGQTKKRIGGNEWLNQELVGGGVEPTMAEGE